MRWSVCLDPGRPWREVVSLVEHLDSTGWDSVYLCDHFIRADANGWSTEGAMLEGWTALAALAGITRRVRLGTLVLGNTYRHPAVVANMAATMDHVSGGRFVLGLGAGWQENEHTAYGIDLPPPGHRLDQLDEACAVISSLLTEPRTTFHGEYYGLFDAVCEPKPLQSKLPLLIGGGGERRTLRVAAKYADEWHAWATPAQFRHKCNVLDRYCEELGRDPARIRRATGADVTIGRADAVVEQLGRYVEAGADEFIWRDDARELSNALDTLSVLAIDVVPQLDT